MIGCSAATSAENCRAHFFPVRGFREIFRRRIFIGEKPFGRIETADVRIGANGNVRGRCEGAHSGGDVVGWRAIEKDGIDADAFESGGCFGHGFPGEQFSFFIANERDPQRQRERFGNFGSDAGFSDAVHGFQEDQVGACVFYSLKDFLIFAACLFDGRSEIGAEAPFQRSDGGGYRDGALCADVIASFAGEMDGCSE